MRSVSGKGFYLGDNITCRAVLQCVSADAVSGLLSEGRSYHSTWTVKAKVTISARQSCHTASFTNTVPPAATDTAPESEHPVTP